MVECLHEKHNTGLVENLPNGTKQVISDEKLGTEALDWLRIWNTLAVFDNGKKIQILSPLVRVLDTCPGLTLPYVGLPAEPTPIPAAA